MFGRPGKISGVILRTLQGTFAAIALGILSTVPGFSLITPMCVYGCYLLELHPQPRPYVVDVFWAQSMCQKWGEYTCRRYHAAVVMAFIAVAFQAISVHIWMWIAASSFLPMLH